MLKYVNTIFSIDFYTLYTYLYTMISTIITPSQSEEQRARSARNISRTLTRELIHLGKPDLMTHKQTGVTKIKPWDKEWKDLPDWREADGGEWSDYWGRYD